MLIDDIICDLVSEKSEHETLIFVLGESSRSYIENGLSKLNDKRLSTIGAIERSQKNVHVLFLNKLQYVYMYLMKIEAEKTEQIEYDTLILYGLDILIEEVRNGDESDGEFNIKQLRLCNLIFNALFKINRKHDLRMVKFIPFNETSNITKQIHKIESYWKYIC